MISLVCLELCLTCGTCSVDTGESYCASLSQFPSLNPLCPISFIPTPNSLLITVVVLHLFLSLVFPRCLTLSLFLRWFRHNEHHIPFSIQRFGGVGVRDRRQKLSSCRGVHWSNERNEETERENKTHLQGFKRQKGVDTWTHFLVKQSYRHCVGGAVRS